MSYINDNIIEEKMTNYNTNGSNNIKSFKRSKSICNTIDHNAVHITKQKCKNGIIVFYTDRYTCVISDTKKINNIPLFLLIKEYNTSTKDDNSYEHWLHVIGKQIKKDERSKYFEQNESLHFNNGTFDKNNEDGINNLIIEAKRLFDSCKKDNKKHINEFVETLICDKRYDISRK